MYNNNVKLNINYIKHQIPQGNAMPNCNLSYNPAEDDINPPLRNVNVTIPRLLAPVRAQQIAHRLLIKQTSVLPLLTRLGLIEGDNLSATGSKYAINTAFGILWNPQFIEAIIPYLCTAILNVTEYHAPNNPLPSNYCRPESHEAGRISFMDMANNWKALYEDLHSYINLSPSQAWLPPKTMTDIADEMGVSLPQFKIMMEGEGFLECGTITPQGDLYSLQLSAMRYWNTGIFTSSKEYLLSKYPKVLISNTNYKSKFTNSSSELEMLYAKRAKIEADYNIAIRKVNAKITKLKGNNNGSV